MAATRQGTVVVNYSSANRTSITQAITVVAGAGNRMLVVRTTHEDAAGAVSGVTFNGVALTKLDSTAASTWSHVEIWYLLNPPVGTFNVVATKASFGNNHWGIAVDVLESVDQTTPWRTPQKGSADTGTSTTRTVASVASGDFVLDVLSIDGTGHTATVGADQTSDYAQNLGAGSNESSGSSQLGSAGGVMSWTWTTSAPNSHLACAAIAAAGGGSAIVLAAVLAGAGGHAADLRVGKPLAAVLAGVGGASGVRNLTVGKSLAAVLGAAGAVVANLTVGGSSSAVLAATSAAAADLRVGKPLAAVLSASSTLQAQLRIGKPLAAVLAGGCTLAASLTVGATAVTSRLRTLMGVGQ